MIAAALGGCGGDARVEFSAADALDALAGSMNQTIQEYHQEVTSFDDTRESEVVAAFVTRVRRDAADEKSVEGHVASFESALRRLREDRDTEWTRRSAATDNVNALREVACGLQKLAIQSLSLQDEMRRYLQSWVDAKKRADTSASRKTSAVSVAAGTQEKKP
jgi:hypothetical protein